MRVVVCTVVHHPADARIYYRQIRALLDAGHQVTYIAPFGELEDFPERTQPSLTTVTIPRNSLTRNLVSGNFAFSGCSAGCTIW